jgi:undecaprenyl-diphosphatase
MNDILLNEVADWPITFLASFLIWIMVGSLLGLWAIKGRIKKEVAFQALLAALIAWGISEFIKFIIPSVRPFQVNGYPPLTLTIPEGNGFPSSHATAAFSIAVMIFLYNKKTGFIFLLSALAVGLGRVLANVHSVIDVIGGIIIGSSVSFFIKRFFSSIVKKG